MRLHIMFEIIFRMGVMQQIDMFAGEGEGSPEVMTSEEGSRSLSDPRRQYEVRFGWYPGGPDGHTHSL